LVNQTKVTKLPTKDLIWHTGVYRRGFDFGYFSIATFRHVLGVNLGRDDARLFLQLKLALVLFEEITQILSPVQELHPLLLIKGDGEAAQSVDRNSAFVAHLKAHASPLWQDFQGEPRIDEQGVQRRYLISWMASF
jgi:hypothetical protein